MGKRIFSFMLFGIFIFQTFSSVTVFGQKEWDVLSEQQQEELFEQEYSEESEVTEQTDSGFEELQEYLHTIFPTKNDPRYVYFEGKEKGFYDDLLTRARAVLENPDGNSSSDIKTILQDLKSSRLFLLELADRKEWLLSDIQQLLKRAEPLLKNKLTKEQTLLVDQVREMKPETTEEELKASCQKLIDFISVKDPKFDFSFLQSDTALEYIETKQSSKESSKQEASTQKTRSVTEEKTDASQLMAGEPTIIYAVKDGYDKNNPQAYGLIVTYNNLTGPIAAIYTEGDTPFDYQSLSKIKIDGWKYLRTDYFHEENQNLVFLVYQEAPGQTYDFQEDTKFEVVFQENIGNPDKGDFRTRQVGTVEYPIDLGKFEAKIDGKVLPFYDFIDELFLNPRPPKGYHFVNWANGGDGLLEANEKKTVVMLVEKENLTSSKSKGTPKKKASSGFKETLVIHYYKYSDSSGKKFIGEFEDAVTLPYDSKTSRIMYRNKKMDLKKYLDKEYFVPKGYDYISYADSTNYASDGSQIHMDVKVYEKRSGLKIQKLPITGSSRNTLQWIFPMVIAVVGIVMRFCKEQEKN